MKNENYDTNIVKKPWGFEYLVYESEKVALWALFIASNQSTSMHCHSKKTTGLIVLDGICEVSFLSEKKILNSLNKIMIRKGLFHSTKSISENGSIVLEIETPKDKFDLVRLKDNYGREGKPYEDSSHFIEKQNSCLWIEDTDKTYNFANSLLSSISVNSIDFFYNIKKNEKIIFLNGGIMDNESKYIISAGDIVENKNILQIIEVFKKIDKETKVLIIGK